MVTVGRLLVLLLGVELLDELASGVPSVGAAEIQRDLALTYAMATLALVTVPTLVALVIEPALFVLADRYSKKWFVAGGLALMGGAGFLAALAPSLVGLTVAMCLLFLGSGAGTTLAQAALVDANPDRQEQNLARWALFGEVGDLLAPMLLGGLAVFAGGWRLAFGAVGLLLVGWAGAVALSNFPTPAADDVAAEAAEAELEPSILDALKQALQNRQLMGWLGAGALCSLLDETVVVFLVWYLKAELGAGPAAQSAVVGAGIVGAIAGVMVMERLLPRMGSQRLLVASSALGTVVYAAWLFLPSAEGLAIGFFWVGFTVAPHYPLASARAFQSLPGRSGTVLAAGHAFTPLTMLLPWLLGLLADAVGVWWALALLIVQPVGLLVTAVSSGPPRKPLEHPGD